VSPPRSPCEPAEPPRCLAVSSESRGIATPLFEFRVQEISRDARPREPRVGAVATLRPVVGVSLIAFDLIRPGGGDLEDVLTLQAWRRGGWNHPDPPVVVGVLLQERAHSVPRGGSQLVMRHGRDGHVTEAIPSPSGPRSRKCEGRDEER